MIHFPKKCNVCTKLRPTSLGLLTTRQGQRTRPIDADHKKAYAHMIAVYAAALSYCDTQMGRIMQGIEEIGQTDNTLVIYIQGDNGASAEGTP